MTHSEKVALGFGLLAVLAGGGAVVAVRSQKQKELRRAAASAALGPGASRLVAHPAPRLPNPRQVVKQFTPPKPAAKVLGPTQPLKRQGPSTEILKLAAAEQPTPILVKRARPPVQSV